MLVLGLESTCDETACSLVRNGHEILSNAIASQIDLHTTYGGVVPELACRRHIDVLIPIIDQALQEAGVALEAIDAIAVAKGPGLIGALLIGLNAAKAMAFALNKPLIGVNHVEAHLYAALMPHLDTVSFPCLGAVLSGGHTTLLYIEGLGQYQVIGQTQDDAIGEAFDKVAKILGLPYPGGPEIERLAKTGHTEAYPFRAGQVKGSPYDFSFSGLKTAVLYAAKGIGSKMGSPLITHDTDLPHIAATFQEVALKAVIDRCTRAAKEYDCHTLLLGGGVTHNQRLRKLFSERAPQIKTLWPIAGLELDNAAMIAGLGYHKLQERPKGDSMALEAQTRMPW